MANMQNMKIRVCSAFNAAVHRRINAGLTAFVLAGGMLVAGCSDKNNTTPPPVPPVPETPQGAPQKPDDVAQEPHAPRDAMQEAAFKTFGKDPDSSRDLTEGENKLLHGLFGDSLNLKGVRIHFYKNAYKDIALMTLDNDATNIYVFKRQHKSDDYSKEENRFLFGAFVHEATGLWTAQQKGISSTGDYDGDNYNLASDLRFKNYSPALQSSLMRDFALRFLHPSHQGTWLAQKWGKDNCSADKFLSNVVEAQFPAAKATRQAMTVVQPLNENEKTLVSAFFGNEVDPSVVRKHFQPWRCALLDNPGYTMATVDSPRDINVLGSDYSSKDYSREKNLENFGMFMHEMDHIWQRQTGHKMTNYSFVNKDNPYAYPIDIKKWKFADYGIEQQAAIVEDYVRVFLRPERNPNRMDNDDAKFEQLKTLVEDQYPGARRLREYFDRHGRLPTPETPEFMARPAAGAAPKP